MSMEFCGNPRKRMCIEYHGIKHQILGRVLAGYATHCNVGGTLVVGLGCEQTTSGYLTEHHGLVSLHARMVRNGPR